MPHDRTQSDAGLVRLAQSGELWAFDELARRYQSTVLRFLKRRLSGNDVEDVAQESFVRAYARLRQCRADASFKSWLLAIVYREMIDHLRRPKMSMASSEAAADGAGPMERVSADEHRTMLWSLARKTLSEDQFTAVWLFYAEDLTTAEIARVMNRSWASVKVMLHRARSKLAETIDPKAFIDVREVVQAGKP